MVTSSLVGKAQIASSLAALASAWRKIETFWTERLSGKQRKIAIISVTAFVLIYWLSRPSGDREATLQAWRTMDDASVEAQNVQAESGAAESLKRWSILYSQIPLRHVDHQLADFIRDCVREYHDDALILARRNNEYNAVDINLRQANQALKPFSTLAQTQQDADAINSFTGALLEQNRSERISKIDGKYKEEIDAAKARLNALGKRNEELQRILAGRYK